MTTYQNIEDSINALKDEDTTENQHLALHELHEQLYHAAQSMTVRDELSEWIKSDDDVLSDFDQETAFYEDVRNIQDQIINTFGETE